VAPNLYSTLGWWLDVAIITLASLRGFFRFRALPTSLRYLTLFAAFEACMELLSKALVRVFQLKSNLFLLPLDVIGTVGLLALAYGQVVQSAALKRVLPWVLGIFGIYTLVDTLAGLGTVRYLPGVQVVGDLLMLSLAGLYFRQLLQELRIVHLGREPFFWLSVGTAVYTLGDLQLALFSNYVLHHVSLQPQLVILSLVRILLLFTFYSGCCLALWMPPQK
jgi:hypothetical protein